jgi:adenylate kinase
VAQNVETEHGTSVADLDPAVTHCVEKTPAAMLPSIPTVMKAREDQEEIQRIVERDPPGCELKKFHDEGERKVEKSPSCTLKEKRGERDQSWKVREYNVQGTRHVGEHLSQSQELKPPN